MIFLYVTSPMLYRIKVGTCFTSGEVVGSVKWSRSSSRTITYGTETLPRCKVKWFSSWSGLTLLVKLQNVCLIIFGTIWLCEFRNTSTLTRKDPTTWIEWLTQLYWYSISLVFNQKIQVTLIFTKIV